MPINTILGHYPISNWYRDAGKGEERGGQFRYEGEWWCYAKTGNPPRIEACGECICYDRDGIPVRREWPDREGGIPVWFMDGNDGTERRDGLAWPADENVRKHRKPLKLEGSWLVNPQLIPEIFRIPDQPERHLPLKLKPGASAAEKR